MNFLKTEYFQKITNSGLTFHITAVKKELMKQMQIDYIFYATSSASK